MWAPDSPEFAGIWEMKSVTVDGTAATRAEMATLLKGFGGVEAGMVYKFRSNGFGSLNGFGKPFRAAPCTSSTAPGTWFTTPPPTR